MSVLSTCDATTDWIGAALTIDTVDKKEGSGSLKDTVATPSIESWCATIYNETGLWDLSTKKHILLWLYCDRASTAFTEAWIMVQDTTGDYRYWNLTFAAGEWTAFKLLLSAGDGDSGTPDLALITNLQITFLTADTDAFYKKIDYIRLTEHSQGMRGDGYFLNL